MKLLVAVDQAAALRAGIDAPSSTVTLEVTPSELDDSERELLASIMQDGHDCKSLTLVRPDLEGLRRAISQYADEAETKRAEEEARAAERREQKDREIAKCLEDGQLETISVYLRDDCGKPFPADWGVGAPPPVYVRLDVPTVPYVLSADRGSPAAVHRYESAREQIQRDRDSRIADTRPELIRLTQEHEERRAAKRAEYDALYARLPEMTRARHQAGYASHSEIERKLRTLIRRDAGYGGYKGWDQSTAIQSLTDAEYEIFRRAETEAPDGAKVTAIEVWDTIYRRADDDEYEDADDDGELEERTNIRRIALITWRRVGVDCRAVVTLS